MQFNCVLNFLGCFISVKQMTQLQLSSNHRIAFIFTAETTAICSQILLNLQTLHLWTRNKHDAKQFQFFNVVVFEGNIIGISWSKYESKQARVKARKTALFQCKQTWISEVSSLYLYSIIHTCIWCMCGWLLPVINLMFCTIDELPWPWMT